MSKKILKFPKGFLWGTGTAAHQVEGGNDKNDFWFWEKSPARIEALKKEGKNPQDFISGIACDHYWRFEEDFDLAKSLNNNAHRFSIEWSRIEPEEGIFNQKEIEHYQKVIDALRKRGLEPFVTLHHFTSPLWFSQKGGWTKKESVKYFARYVETIVKNLKDVRFWVTINEPVIYAFVVFCTSKFLQFGPEKRKPNLCHFFKTIKNFAKAHQKAYQIIHQNSRDTQVGVAKQNIYFEPLEDRPINRFLASFACWFWNRRFFNGIRKHLDFIGLNYYFHTRINFNWRNFKESFDGDKSRETDELGRTIYPKGIYYLLMELERYNKPIYITENGLADTKDRKRTKFIIEHLKWVHKAIENGLDVRGYFHWSLMDNFEWESGFAPRFGLFEVDYKSLKRTPRPSARIYAEICKENKLNL